MLVSLLRKCYTCTFELQMNSVQVSNFLSKTNFWTLSKLNPSPENIDFLTTLRKKALEKTGKMRICWTFNDPKRSVWKTLWEKAFPTVYSTLSKRENVILATFSKCFQFSHV